MPADQPEPTANTQAPRVHLRYSGRVQGVGFRATTRDIASRHAVAGWVRNESDGSVTTEFQGEPAEIERCLAEIERTMARNIETAHRREAQPEPDETGFSIRYS